MQVVFTWLLPQAILLVSPQPQNAIGNYSYQKELQDNVSQIWDTNLSLWNKIPVLITQL